MCIAKRTRSAAGVVRLGRDARRAVAERGISARRVLRRNTSVEPTIVSRFRGILRQFGSLAPPVLRFDGSLSLPLPRQIRLVQDGETLSAKDRPGAFNIVQVQG
jgi:hypothetical protein